MHQVCSNVLAVSGLSLMAMALFFTVNLSKRAESFLAGVAMAALVGIVLGATGMMVYS